MRELWNKTSTFMRELRFVDPTCQGSNMAQVVVLLHEEGSEDRCRRNRAGRFPTQQGSGDQIQIPSF